MKQILFYSFCAFFSSFLFAQNTKNLNFENNLKSNTKVESFFMNQDRQTPSMIKVKSNYNLSISGVPAFLKDALQIDTDSFQFTLSNKSVSKSGSEIITFSAFYKGVKLEHAKYKAFVKAGTVKFITLEHYAITDGMNQSVSLTNDQARNFATNDVGAEIYVWDTINYLLSKTVNNDEVLALQAEYKEYFPVGDLVYVDDYTTPEADLKLAYKFNIYAAEPVYRANVFIDAQTGRTLLADAIIKHANEINEKRAEAKSYLSKKSKTKPVYGPQAQGSGDTRYAGNRTFQTTLNASDPLLPKYSLDGTIDLSPFGIVDDPTTPDINEALVLNETRSYDGIGGAPISINGIPSYSIFDGFSRTEELQTVVELGDNNWNAAEHYRNDFSFPYPLHNETNNDDIALDAHWGAEIVVKYWADIHGRSSHDNKGKKIINYVHYGDAYDNAFWNGTAMTYGDGSYQGGTNPNGSFAPLTSLDVCGHEIGHGVCTATADLVYARESGAMNEGFSDIWAASVENYVLTQIDGSLPYDPWGIGEQIDERDGGLEPGNATSQALRWMDDPNAEGNPSFYGGQDWAEPECGEPTLANDQCGVHNNSGVLNKWFYLLVTGSGQPFSPGADKITADPSKADRGLGYDYYVEGVGFGIADQITFKAEELLTANAKFEEMRNASILVAETEYSSYEVEQVTNAWYAVGVGEQYITPDPNVLIFDSSSVSLTSEGTPTNGCNEFKTVIVSVTAASITSTQTAVFNFDDSTAILGEDFDISPSSLTFGISGTPLTQQVIVTIYNDGLIEDNEEIQMNFANGPAETDIRKHKITILDDDYAPNVGSGTVELLNETFDTTERPAEWFVSSEFDVNTWVFNGTGPTSAGRAYVVPSVFTTIEPLYDGTANSSIHLISKPVNARGVTNVTVSFDWEAGGENDGTAFFDWGEFMYSLDGATYESVQKFSTEGSPGGLGPNASGTFNLAMPELDNQAFTLIWRWYNDAILQGPYSFSIDNVSVIGDASKVEGDLTHSSNQNVNAGNQIYFISNEDADVIGFIENTSADLGCVTLTVVDNGGSENFSNIGGSRSGKVIEIQADGVDASTATYDITLFFTDEELSDFSDPNSLQMIKVNSSNIDDATNDPTTNYAVSGGLLEENTSQEYRTFKGTFVGNGTLALASLEVLANPGFNVAEFKVFPTVIDNLENITIVNAKTAIETVSIYDISGKLIQTVKFNNVLNVIFPVSSLSSGLYFLNINNDKANTFKFIVK